MAGNGFTSVHRTDGNGSPAGGTAESCGVAINWQNGPLQTEDGRVSPNGAFVEDVIAIAADRIAHYQQTKFACEDNENALMHLNLAIEALQRRTKSREARGIEGTHEV